LESAALKLDGLQFRKALSSDIDELLPLYESLFGLEEDFEYNAEKQRQGLRLLIEGTNSVVFVATLNHDIIAMCNMQTYVSTAAGGYAGIIEDVAVDKRFRGMGVGTELLAHCENFAQARGLERLHLLMDSNNTLAKVFYTGQNWKETQLVCMQKFFSE
jgi:ribosomal protein S18 acetylase RimI-like enzyme